MNATMIHETASQQRATRRTNVILLAAILVVINVLGTSLFVRWDMTGKRIYSLSRASKEVVRGLEDRLTVKAYFSDDLTGVLSVDAVSDEPLSFGAGAIWRFGD